ncbi:MAG: DnaJ domain-containing protein [Clostridia bacterium]|nr:DnaJ domain-containing protein [Clostridia bacterium]MBR6641381.1 DnaJ domain-containing protein [Clostridia bacterium]
MKPKDYYALLGVHKRSSKEEIKQNYRKLAKKYHPDANVGKPEMEEIFKDLTVGYDILMDKDKKKKYDRQVVRYNYGAPPKVEKEKTKKYGVKNENTANEFVSTILGFGKDATETIKTKASEFKVNIASKKIAKKGDNIEAILEIALEEGLFGAEKKVSLKAAGGKVNTYTVQVPKGIKDGEKIRLAALGKPGKNGGKNGDLIITVKLKEQTDVKLDKLDLHSKLSISYAQAIVGDKVRIKMFGESIEVTVPANTKEGDKIVVDGRGYTTSDGTRGKLILEATLAAPTTITDKERKIYEQLLRAEKQQAKGK